MDYKEVVAGTPHVLQYLRKTIEVPVKESKISSRYSGQILIEEQVVKYGVVVAVKVDGVVQFGWSICSDLDKFNRTKGRAVAIYRALSGKMKLENLPRRGFPETIVEEARDAVTLLSGIALERL